MENKIDTLFDYIKTLSEPDLDRIIQFVLGIVSVNQQSEYLPDCPYCGGSHVIKHAHKNRKQRFMCHDCKRTFMHTTNTLMANFHYTQSVWIDFIQDTLYGETLDGSAEKIWIFLSLACLCDNLIISEQVFVLKQKFNPTFF